MNALLLTFLLEPIFLILVVTPPYLARLELDNERPFFHVEGEVRVYLGHFMTGLRFPLDSGLLEILRFYNVTLCHYSPASIGFMTSFISLFCLKGLPFAVDTFCYFFYVIIISDGTVSMGAHENKKLIMGILQNYHDWHEQIIFVSLPNDFHIPLHWRNFSKGYFVTPELSEEEIDF